jgi:hypothetical protein
VGGLDRPISQRQRGKSEYLAMQLVQCEQRQDGIDNRIDGAHFVEVHLVDRAGPVDVAFGRGEGKKSGHGRTLDPRRQILIGGALDEMANLRKVAQRTNAFFVKSVVMIGMMMLLRLMMMMSMSMSVLVASMVVGSIIGLVVPM